jgi:excisionase family DNA binding protein
MANATTTQQDKTMLTLVEVAQAVGVSPRTVRRWLHKGLKAFRRGRTLRIREADLNDFISDNTR